MSGWERDSNLAHYQVEQADDGALCLVPVASISKRELAVLSNLELMTQIRKGIEDAREGKTTSMDFSQYLDDEETD